MGEFEVEKRGFDSERVLMSGRMVREVDFWLLEVEKKRWLFQAEVTYSGQCNW